VARCGLYHSAYSNSYVNLAIFKPDTGRETVRSAVGTEAEELVLQPPTTLLNMSRDECLHSVSTQHHHQH
jgi:hypothetical protein